VSKFADPVTSGTRIVPAGRFTASPGSQPLALAAYTRMHNARLCAMSGSAAPALDALLARHQIDVTSTEILDELDAAFTRILGSGAASLSTTEVEFLHQHTRPSEAAVIDAWSADDERQDRTRTALRQLTNAISESVSIKEAAAILNVDRSRISRRIAGNALSAFDLRGNRRIPRWQFLDGKLLPGLDAIVPAIPRDATPALLDAFMHTPQPDFDDRTPIEYLASGGNPTMVARFIDDLTRW
jgi:hypothetical protein